MSLGEDIPALRRDPPDSPSDLTQKELADYSPSKRNVLLYERQRDDLIQSRDDLQIKYDELLVKFQEEMKFRSAYARLKRGKFEQVVQQMLSSLFAGFGALGLGIFSRTDPAEVAYFWICATLAGIGVILGVFIWPVILLIYYVYPNFSGQSPREP